jgi:hypothetical protein
MRVPKKAPTVSGAEETVVDVAAFSQVDSREVEG